MDHNHLTTLLQHAREAETLDRDLHGITAHEAFERASTPAHRRRVRLVGAATVLLLFVLGITITAMVSSRIGAHAPSSTTPAAPANQSMMIALYRPDDNKTATCPECWCVQSWKPEFGRDLAAVGDEELIGASIERACVQTPARMVVIGLSGPADSLPKSDDQAREVAMCMLEKTESGSLKPVGCVASNVDVRVQKWTR